MEHLLTGPLPGCESLEQAEENHRIDAMQMELRERRVLSPDWEISMKTVEHHFDELRAVDQGVYTTYLYVKSRLGVIFSHLRDEQLRNALKGIGFALHQLYSDHDVIRPAVHCYRRAAFQVSDEMLTAVRDRVAILLPRMLTIVTDHAKRDIAATPRTSPTADEVIIVSLDGDGSDVQVYKGGNPAQSSLLPTNAEAALRLRTLIYQRHPIDLLREISNWLTDMEHAE